MVYLKNNTIQLCEKPHVRGEPFEIKTRCPILYHSVRSGEAPADCVWSRENVKLTGIFSLDEDAIKVYRILNEVKEIN